ncbi:MAG: valine--tRNA ligase, partial [Anaerolineales bacterium]|nr:valine--tRNA ligase [Anaerolineales bacterium]
RNLRAEYDVTPGRRIGALIAAGGAAAAMESQRSVLSSLAKLDPAQLVIAPALEAPAQAASVIVGEAICYLPLADLVDLEAERERLQKALAEVEGRIARSQSLLASDFAAKAPEQVVQRERDKLADLQVEEATLRERLADLHSA